MINGDFAAASTRLESQHDAVGMLITGKLGANPENTVGMLTYGGRE